MVKRTAPKDTEVEWQFDALDLRPAERWFGALATERVYDPSTLNASDLVLSAVITVAKPAERLVDTYFDTADWRMGRSGHVLRVRNRGGRGEVTLKGIAQSDSGLRRRLEVTEPLPAGGVGALGIDGPVGWRLRALAGKRALQPILEVRTRRRPFDLRVSGEAVAEAALDETTIVVGSVSQPVRLQRVEVEVQPEWVDRFPALVETLRRECGLQPAALSKFEAGLLAAGLRVPAPPELGPVSYDANPSVGEVAFAVLRRNFAAVLGHETGTRLGEDAEELHDMRVATRRTRGALALFENALPVRARHIRTELGWLADALGAVRDLDVQLGRVDEWRRDVPEEDRAALADLAALLGREREEARKTLLACLDSARYERMVASFTTMLRQGPSRRSATARAPAETIMPDLIEALHRSTTKAARRARRSGDPADFHRTRIRIKRLRYALEFVSEIYERRTARYLRHVVKLQDGLGLMQDARVAAARLHELATARGSTLSPTTVFVMGGVTERYRTESERLARKVPGLLHELGGPEWRKLTSVMERRRLDLSTQYRWPSPAPPPTALRPAAAPQGQAPRPSANPTSESQPPAEPAPTGPLERSVGGPLSPAVWSTSPVAEPAPAPAASSSGPGPGPGPDHPDEARYPSSNGGTPRADGQ